MGRYPECSYEQIDLLAGGGFPVACTLKEGVLSPSLAAVNTYAKPVTDLVHLRTSAVGGAFIAYIGAGNFCFGLPSNATVVMPIPGVYKASSPFSLEVREGANGEAVLFTDDRYLRMRNASYYVGAFEGNLSCGVMHCGRMFGGDRTNGYIFKWSGQGGYIDWQQGISGAGQVYLDPQGGTIRDVFDFEEKLVILRERGLTQFTADGNPENFRLGETIGLPAVYAKTAAKTAGCILFCTVDGLYRYKNGKAEKLKGLITNDMTAPVCAYSDGARYYFVSGTSAFLKRKVVYMYDALDDIYTVIDAPAYYISADTTSVIAYAENAVYRLTGSDYSYFCAAADFGTKKRKLLREIEAETEGEVTAALSNGKYTRKITLTAGKTRLNMRGKEFTVTLSGTGVVRSLKITAEVRK